MVEILGLKKVKKMILKMPLQPHCFFRVCILSAFQIYGNVHLGEYADNMALYLQPGEVS